MRELNYKLKGRLADIKRLQDAAIVAKDAISQQANEARVREIDATKAEIWAAVAEMFHDQINQRVSSHGAGLVAVEYRPGDKQEAEYFRSQASRRGIGEGANGWAAKDIFHVLMSELAHRLDQQAEIDNLFNERNELEERRAEVSRLWRRPTYCLRARGTRQELTAKS